MRRPPIEGLTIRAAVVLGFGMTLGLWGFAGYQWTGQIARIQGEATALNDRYMRAQEALSTARSELLVGSVQVRDALLDPAGAATQDHRLGFERASLNLAVTLAEYVPVTDSQDELLRLADLRQETEKFRAAGLQALQSASPNRDGRLLLARVMPQRERVLRLADDALMLNRRAFVEYQTSVSDIYGRTQRLMWQQFGLAVAISLAIALLATFHAGALEGRLRARRARDLENTRNLQRLSAKLITAQEEERRTIARELHDEIGQVLTTIKVELALAQRALNAVPGAGGLLAGAQSITDSAIHGVRDLSHLLHPAVLDDLGLIAAIDWYLTGFGRRHHIAVELVSSPMEDRLVPEVEAAAYRIVQEALTNVARHAGATRCVIRLDRVDQTLSLTVTDDGRGFDAGALERGGEARGLGLLGIQERAAALQGVARVDSAPGQGTRITVRLPARVREPLDVREFEAAAASGGGPVEG